MRSFYLLFALIPALLLIRCAAVPMPATVIPERGNSLEATLYAGNNGFGINTLYATKRRMVFNLALQASRISANSRAYDIGIGKVLDDSLHNHKAMFMITGGYGKYTVYPFIQLGGTGDVAEVNSDAARISLYSNFSFDRKNGVVARISGYRGKSSERRINVDPVEKHAFFTGGLQVMYYFVPGKRRHFVMGSGLEYSIGKGGYNKDHGEKDFNPSPIFLFLGYRLAKDP